MKELNRSQREQGPSRGMKKKKTQLNRKAKRFIVVGKSLQDKQLCVVPGCRGKSGEVGNSETLGNNKWKDESWSE